jgi:DNA-binding MarR family transcriptional regulator
MQLLRAAETIWNASRVFFEPWEISPSQFNLLNLLTDSEDGSTQIELSRELLVHRSNVTGLVDRLEQRGLVARREIPGDRRAYRVRLTPAGRRLMAEILPRYYRAAEDALTGLSLEETKRLERQLDAIRRQTEMVADRLDLKTPAPKKRTPFPKS